MKAIYRGVISKFSVSRKSYSDHFPLNISISCTSDLQLKSISLPGRLPWSQKNLGRYQTSLGNLANPEYINEPLNINDKLTICINKIRCSTGNFISVKKFDPKNKWYDWECENQRKKKC